jgi:hypothetical protein
MSPGQVGAGGNAQRGLERPARPPAVSRVFLVESEDHPGPFGEQVAAVAGNPADPAGHAGHDQEPGEALRSGAVPWPRSEPIDGSIPKSRWSGRHGL